jgi:DNA-binding NarL/FixJ family response regulator
MSSTAYHPTPARLAALHAVAECGSIKAAARRLGRSPHTVDAHLDHLRDATGLRGTVELIRWAADHHWFQGEGLPGS